MEIVRKGEAAKRWNIDAAMISRYATRGMPVRADGKLDWEAVDQWRRDNIVPELSGSHNARTARLTDAVAIVNALHGRGVKVLTAITIGLGLSALDCHKAVELMLCWADATLGESTMQILYPNLTGVRVDYSALDGLKLTKTESKQLDAFVDKLTAILAEKA